MLIIDVFRFSGDVRYGRSIFFLMIFLKQEPMLRIWNSVKF